MNTISLKTSVWAILVICSLFPHASEAGPRSRRSQQRAAERVARAKAPAPSPSCPKGYSVLAKAAFGVGGLALMGVAGAGVYTWVTSDDEYEIHIDGEIHDGDAVSDRRRAELKALHAAGKIILVEENTYAASEKIPRTQRIWNIAFDSNGLESELPHAAAAYDMFRRLQSKRVLMDMVRDASENAKDEATFLHLKYFQTLYGEETLLEFIDDALLHPELLPLPAQFEASGVSREVLTKTFARLSDYMTDKKILNIVQSRKGSMDLVPTELADLFISNAGLATVLSFAEYMDGRLLKRLQESKDDPKLQTPDEVIEYVKSYPSFIRTTNPRDFMKPPYGKTVVFEPLTVGWRNAVMQRHLREYAKQAKAEGKPLHVLVGDKHVDDFAQRLIQEYPDTRIVKNPLKH